MNGCSDACPDYCKNPEKDSRLSERFTGLVNNRCAHQDVFVIVVPFVMALKEYKVVRFFYIQKRMSEWITKQS